MMSPEEELEYQTVKYWKSNPNAEKYIEGLLHQEVNYLKGKGKITEKLYETEILVQLVGYSWEPLLISICAHKPDVVVPILNKKYIEDGDGEVWGDKYKENICKLKEQDLIDNIDGIPQIIPSQWVTVGDQPKDVFRFLKTHVLPFVNEGKKVVVDITGAKKSMASGAYLFSSYTNAPVVYLNYDKYSKNHGPYGYTCKLDKLENPLKIFKLHEWSRVRQLYENYAFRSANTLVMEIRSGTVPFLEDKELKSIDALVEWLEFYRLWDEGDYKGGLTKWNDLCGVTKCMISDAHCPSAVWKLGEIWPDKKNYNDLKSDLKRIEGLADIEESLYLKDEEILAYACDELEKIKRLVKHNEDYRSALLRAAGLNETLLKARVVRSWIQNKFVVEVRGEQITREDIRNHNKYNLNLHKIDKKLNKMGAYNSLKMLQWKTGENAYAITLFELNKSEEHSDMVGAHRSDKAPLLNEFWKDLKRPEEFYLPYHVFKCRNKAIHFCLSISKELAEVAVNMAEENSKDFQKHWMDDTLTNGKYETMGWNELCDVCGINFLPKKSEEE